MKSFTFLFLLLFNFSASYAQVNLPATTMNDIEIFSRKSLNEKTDLEEVKSKIKTLLILENEDPSRTAVLMLSESYNKHTALYEKAIKSIENKKNKKQLKEIRAILKNFSKSGNG